MSRDGVEAVLNYLSDKEADEVRRLLLELESKAQADAQAKESKAQADAQAEQAALQEAYQAELSKIPRGQFGHGARIELRAKYRQRGMLDAQPVLGVDRIRAAKQTERQARAEELRSQPEQAEALRQAYQADLARAPKGTAFADYKRSLVSKYRELGLDI